MRGFRHSSSLCLLLILIVSLSGCGSPPPLSPKPTLQPCNINGTRARCGSLPVFEDRAAQSGRKIDIRFAVIPARGANPAPDPIFWVAGGPGASALESAPYAMRMMGAANQQRDIVLVDQRGTGGSNLLMCPRPDDPAGQAEAVRACLASLDADPGAYTTAWAADDFDEVRAALGYDQINLYGESYGPTAIQVYIQRHGEHVRTATLAGASLLDVPMIELWPVSSQRALDLLFSRCEEDSDCRAAYPDLRQEFSAVLALLEESPVTLSINDPSTGKPLVFSAAMFRTTVHGALAGTETSVLLPAAIHLIYTENWEGFTAFIAPFLGSNPQNARWKVMNLEILCYEDWAKTPLAETTAAAAGSYMTYADVRALSVPEEICAVMPPPPSAALYGPVANSDVPVLVINGEADPQDPPENVAAAKERYPNSLVLVAPGQGHGYTGTSCRAKIVADFLAQGTVNGLQTACLDQVPLPPFAR